MGHKGSDKMYIHDCLASWLSPQEKYGIINIGVNFAGNLIFIQYM